MKTVSPKNIALFIDGTWNRAWQKNQTNVRKLFDRAYARSGPEQVVHYIAGVGADAEKFAHLPFWVRRAGIPRQSDNIFAGSIRKCAWDG